MSEDYSTYQQEYDQCISKVRSFLSSNARSLTTLRECDRLLSAARRCATSMEQLAEESGDPFKINVSKRRVSEDIAPLLAEVGRATQERENGDYVHQQNQRSELFSGYRAPTLNDGSGEGNGDTDDMEMLIRNSDDLLRESQALCAETEETGAETLGLMGRQREQLQNASNHLSGAQAYIIEAKDILQAMSKKALRNKLFLKFIIAVLFLANVLVFVSKVMKKRGRKNPDAYF